MACRYTYKGKTYEAWEFEDVLLAMSPTEAAAFMPSVKVVVDAPFIKSTDAVLNLALKRIITMAVEGGYEKVAFVNGQQSADRYDLSKQVDAVRVAVKPDTGAYMVFVTQNTDRNPQRVTDREGVDASKLADIIGKELAQRAVDDLAAGRKANYSGLDLKVGGEGMKTFYDSIVPQAVKKLISKMDGRLDAVSVALPSNVTREDQSAFEITHDDTALVTLRRQMPDGEFVTIGRMPESNAWAYIEDPANYTGQIVQQPGFSITPKMQQQVDSGLPMFSRTQPLQGQNFTIPGEGFLAKQQRLWQDYFAPVKAVQDAILKGGGSITEASDVYKAEERMYGRVEEVLRDFRDKHFTPMIERATELDITPDEIALYAYAKHAPERNAHIATINKRFPDGGSGMTNAEAAAIIAKAKQEGKFTALEELHTNLMAITQGTRQEMLVNELITQDEFDALDGMFENYVPLRGLAEDVDQPIRSGGGYNIRGKETIRALGRKTKAKDIMENIVNDYERAVSRGEKNLVGQTFLELIRRNPDPDLWEIDAVRTKQAWDRQKQKVKTVSDVDSGPDTVAVKVKGREVYIKIHDENLLRAMRKAYKTETSGIERFLTATLGGFNNMLRATLTQYNPVFGFVNWTRDFQMGAVGVADELGFGAVGSFTANQKKAMGAANRYVNGKLDISNPVDKLFQEFRMAGATTGGFYAKDAEHVKSEIRNIMLAAGAKPVGFIENVKTLGGTRAGKVMMRGVSSVGSVLEHFGLMTENATRFAAYMTARENGKSPAQAASIAKNLTTNFNRKGEYGQAMNAAYLFFNAAVQGSARVAQSFKNKKIWGLAAGLVGSGAMLAAYAVSVGGDDDDGQAYWDKIPDFEKERNFIIMLPPGYKMDGAETIGKDGRYIKIPMPYGFSVFPAMGYVMHDVARHQQDKTTGVSAIKGAARMTSAVMGSFNPFGGAFDPSDSTSVMMAAAPTAADVVIQQAMGVNAFGRKTAPFKGDFDTDPDSENVNPRQAGSVYHMIARGLNYATGGDEAQSGAIDVAPGSIENAVKTITGGTGTFMTDVFVNLPVKVFDASTGADAEITKRDLPLIRNFLGDVDGMNDSSLLYERRREIIKAKSALKNYSDIGLEPNMTSEQMALAYMAKTSNQYSKAMSAIRKQEIQIALNDEMTRAEKAKARKELTRERDELAQAFNEAYMEVMRGERDGDFAIDK